MAVIRFGDLTHANSLPLRNQQQNTRKSAPQTIRLLPQVALIAAAVAAYFLVRGFTEAAYPKALDNAHRVVRLERWFGLQHELDLQRALVSSPALRQVFNSIYIWGHWPVIVVTLLWLARRRPELYLRTRNAMLISGSIGLVIFACFPVAPPRLASIGLADTVSASSEAYRMMQPTIFTNQYAAVPSLHVGWNLLIGLAIIYATRNLALRIAAITMVVAMASAVVLTANHYLIDGMIGAALTTTCWIAVGWWCGKQQRAARDQQAPPPPVLPTP